MHFNCNVSQNYLQACLPLRSHHHLKIPQMPHESDPIQLFLDRAAEASAAEGIRQGLDDLAADRARPAADVFAEFRARRGIPR